MGRGMHRVAGMGLEGCVLDSADMVGLEAQRRSTMVQMD
jgi:hypothetical protein